MSKEISLCLFLKLAKTHEVKVHEAEPKRSFKTTAHEVAQVTELFFTSRHYTRGRQNGKYSGSKYLNSELLMACVLTVLLPLGKSFELLNR